LKSLKKNTNKSLKKKSCFLEKGFLESFWNLGKEYFASLIDIYKILSADILRSRERKN